MELEALRHKVYPPHVLVVRIRRNRPHGGVDVGVADGDPLDGVLGAALVHLDELPVAGEVVGDLLDPGHPGVDELDGVVAVLVRHHLHGRGNRQGRELKQN